MADESVLAHSDKRSRIIVAAQRLFLRHGFKRTSIEDVANEAGVAKGTVYLYLDSKEALLSAVAERFCEETLTEASAALVEPRPPTEQLVGFLDAYVGKFSRHISQTPEAAQVLRSHKSILTEVGKSFDARLLTLLQSALKTLGIEREDAADMFLAAAWGAFKTGDPAPEPYRARLAAMIDILIVGLKHP
ncbi:transcriptional regulator, TetR family [Singulisphaera sp. GP187]|uniref:TetR/AcrR family transcriptional regulator n=1 Tax=Singulisphaera sp. GP187 TaxID=1882752 RepID=UPI0009270D8A|nr:TetR/AcrR family transcriptional regulator [Singulisphaera sp. GP187]SIO58850.1 transcriptional regulator, TetR family [Singulisphaera sp. GP187]